MDRKKNWYFVGCKPQSDVVAACQHCGANTEIIHSLELHVAHSHVCLKCAEELVRDADKGLPTWADSTAKRGGLGYQGWASRWHWEDYNGPWNPVDVGAVRG